MNQEARRILYFLILASGLLLPALLVKGEEPIPLKAKSEDIALTDDLNIARAQVAKYPDNTEAHFNLAVALSRTSSVENAIKELRTTKLLLRKPENKGLMDNKIKEFKDILKFNPDANNVRYRLAFAHYLKAYLISKEIEKSKENLPKIKNQKKKSNSLDLFSSNKLLVNQSNPAIKENIEKSVFYFEELLKNDPNDSWGKIYYGFILVEQKDDIEKAKELWTEVLNNDPNNPGPHFFIGELHIKEGNLKEGLIEISQALLLRSQGY